MNRFSLIFLILLGFNSQPSLGYSSLQTLKEYVSFLNQNIVEYSDDNNQIETNVDVLELEQKFFLLSEAKKQFVTEYDSPGFREVDA